MPALPVIIDAAPPQDKEVPWLEQFGLADSAPSGLCVREHVDAGFRGLLDLVHRAAGKSGFEAFERQLIVELFRLGRLLINLFLYLGHERLEADGGATPVAGYRRQAPKRRWLGTYFGKVCYWRTYLHRSHGGGGRYPLDEKLGLVADGFSFGLLGRATRLATKMSYEATTSILSTFLGWSPSTATIEKSVLGLGRYTQGFFEQARPPELDGEVLVVQIDSKATPTATAEELRKRRGRRCRTSVALSPRHRGRDKRARWSPKKRRKKGDKSKNGKMATLVVMYTLRCSHDEEGEPVLLGPINPWRYASYAPKRHAVAIARREANKRGFGRGSAQTIQVVTDGDEHLERYVKELFPDAIHTLDVVHAVEYLYDAAACIFPEGSDELDNWVHKQKEALYSGNIHETVIEGDERVPRIRNKAKRKRLERILDYLAKRVDMMNYHELCQRDLEIGSGVVEGAVRYVIGQRFDEGGMRWIRERAEALLQLRCIELNGHWERFLQYAHQRLLTESDATHRQARLLTNRPQLLPKYGAS